MSWIEECKTYPIVVIVYNLRNEKIAVDQVALLEHVPEVCKKLCKDVE